MVSLEEGTVGTHHSRFYIIPPDDLFHSVRTRNKLDMPAVKKIKKKTVTCRLILFRLILFRLRLYL